MKPAELTQADCARLLDFSGELYSADAADARRITLDCALRLLPADFGGCHILRPDGGDVLPLYSPVDEGYPAFHPDFMSLTATHPLTMPLLTRRLRAWKVSDVATRAEFHRTEFYDILYRPLGVEHELCAMLPLQGAPRSLLVLSLHRQRRDFSERDRAVITLMLPHVKRVHERSRQPAAPARLPDLEEFTAGVMARNWGLNRREIEVLFWLRQGKSNADIGSLLGISARTAETHALKSYAKMGVENRYAAIVELLALERRA